MLSAAELHMSSRLHTPQQTSASICCCTDSELIKVVHFLVKWLLQKCHSAYQCLVSLQVVYIDGSHYPQDVLTDAVLAWQLMKHGAIMILDGMQCILQHASAL